MLGAKAKHLRDVVVKIRVASTQILLFVVDVIDPHLFVVVLPLLIALATVARVEIYLQQRRCIFCDSQDLTKD